MRSLPNTRSRLSLCLKLSAISSLRTIRLGRVRRPSLIEKLELDIKPNALSLKLNINAGKLYNLFFVQYSNSRSHKGRKITLRYDEDHPIIVEPESDTDDTAEDEFQYQPVDGDPKATVCYVRGDSGNKSFHDMTDAEKENFLVTSY